MTQMVLEALCAPAVLMSYWWHTQAERANMITELRPWSRHITSHVSSRYVDSKCGGKTLTFIPRQSQRLKSCEWLQSSVHHGGATPVSVTHAFENEHQVATHQHTQVHEVMRQRRETWTTGLWKMCWCAGTRELWEEITMSQSQGFTGRRFHHFPECRLRGNIKMGTECPAGIHKYRVAT